jgi:uncharacterized membrane protein
LAVHALCLVFLSGGVMQECRSYGSAARHGTNAGWWIVDGLLKVIPLASVIALVSCLVAGVFLRAPSIGFGMKGGGLDWWLVVVSAATAAPLALFVSLVLGQLMFGKGLADLEANWSRVVAQATSAAEGSD